MDIEEKRQKIVQFIRQNAGNKPAVLGLSGGLDSSTLAFLAVEALGKENVHGLILPSSTNTEKEVEQATHIAKITNLQSLVTDIDSILRSYTQSTDYFSNVKVLGNLKARVRMSLLYGKANQINGLVLGTGNKTELSIGYFTKYGDGGCDLLPLGDLYKIEVKELARHIGVPG